MVYGEAAAAAKGPPARTPNYVTLRYTPMLRYTLPFGVVLSEILALDTEYRTVLALMYLPLRYSPLAAEHTSYLRTWYGHTA